MCSGADPVANRVGDPGRSAETAADEHLEAHPARVVRVHSEADIVYGDGGAVVRRTRDRDLELPRQIRELRVKHGVLAQEFAIQARIGELVLRAARVLIRSDVAHAVARRLDRGHFDLGEVGQDIGRVLELDPVVLDVLPGREMPEVAVVGPRDVREHAHLPGRQRAVGDVDAQHVGVKLQIQPVHEPQRFELVFVEFAGQAPRHLTAELRDSLGDQLVVEFVVAIHRSYLPGAAARRSVRTDGPKARISSRYTAGRSRPPSLVTLDQVGIDDDAVVLVGLRQCQESILFGIRLDEDAIVDAFDPASTVGEKDREAVFEPVGDDHLWHRRHLACGGICATCAGPPILYPRQGVPAGIAQTDLSKRYEKNLRRYWRPRDALSRRRRPIACGGRPGQRSESGRDACSAAANRANRCGPGAARDPWRRRTGSDTSVSIPAAVVRLVGAGSSDRRRHSGSRISLRDQSIRAHRRWQRVTVPARADRHACPVVRTNRGLQENSDTGA